MKGEDQKYYESCSMPTEFVSQNFELGDMKEQQTPYDYELKQVQDADPHNWEIGSANKQRALYSHLYDEYDKVSLFLLLNYSFLVLYHENLVL